MSQQKALVNIEKSEKSQMDLLRLQLERTRQVNSALWARVNHGSVTRTDDGSVSVATPEQHLASLEAENEDLRNRCRHLEQTLAEVQHTNSELWKRVDHAEQSTIYFTRRKIGAMLRRAGLRK